MDIGLSRRQKLACENCSLLDFLAFRQRHSEVVEEPPWAETPPVHEEPPRTETPSMHDRPTSYVSTADSTRELIEHQEDTSVRPERTVSEMYASLINAKEYSTFS